MVTTSTDRALFQISIDHVTINSLKALKRQMEWCCTQAYYQRYVKIPQKLNDMAQSLLVIAK